MRDIVERLELQAFVADKIQSGMKPLIMDCLEEITHLRCQYEALLNQAEMNARLLTENASLRDESEKLRHELITSSDAAKYYDYGYSCARDMQKDEITRLRAENEKLHREAAIRIDALNREQEAHLRTIADYNRARVESEKLRERLAEADECNRRVSDENEKLREALQPFADIYQDNGLLHSMYIFEMKDLLAAKKVLGEWE